MQKQHTMLSTRLHSQACSIVQLLHGQSSSNAARHGTKRHARHGTARHSTARHGTARHGTAQHSTACTAWHSISQVSAQHELHSTGQHTYRDRGSKASVLQSSLDAGNSPLHVPCLHFKPTALNEEPHKSVFCLSKYAGRSACTSAARPFLF